MFKVQMWHYNSHQMLFLRISMGLQMPLNTEKNVLFLENFIACCIHLPFFMGDTCRKMKHQNRLTLKYHIYLICWSLSDGPAYFIKNDILNSLCPFTKKKKSLIHLFHNLKSFPEVPMRLFTFLFFFNRKTHLKLYNWCLSLMLLCFLCQFSKKRFRNSFYWEIISTFHNELLRNRKYHWIKHYILKYKD